MTDKPFKQGPQGSTAKGTAFDIQPKGDAARNRIKSVRVKAGWAVDSIQVQYETLGTTPSETYLSTPGGSSGGNLVEFSLDSDDYITEIIGSWGTGAPGYPKQEIVTLQFKTSKGVTSPVIGGGNAQKEVEPFSLKAPPDCEIIGFFGEHGNTLYNLGIYLQKIPEATQSRGITKTGKIVINADEWTFRDEGFKKAPDAAVFANNIAKWFAGGRPGKFHAYSNSAGLTGSALAQAMQKAGHTWTTGTKIKFDLPTLLTYDGIFVGGDAADNQVLIEYLKAGGNVYVMAGTGTGGAQSEASRWNPFLNAFGFNYLGQYNSIAGNQTVNNSHPILAGVKTLYQDDGNSIVNLDTASSKNQIILTHSSGQGLIATFEGTPNKPVTKTGKIVVNADEWTLSDEGFKRAPDAAVFATNIAKWFTGGRAGKFHAYSTNFGLTQSALAQAMQKAGHTWTTGTNIKFDLSTLLTYDGIFVGGDAADNQVLIEYVKAGGNVYVMAGTATGDANRWNPFLNAFGFKFLDGVNGIAGNQTVNNSHPILVGVKALYQDNGNFIANLDTASNKNQLVLTSSSGQGLIATFEGTPNKPI